MLIKNINDMENVGNAVEECRGDVYLHLNDGQEKNLKDDEFLLKALKQTNLGEEGLDFRFQNREDLTHFMNQVFNTYQE